MITLQSPDQTALTLLARMIGKPGRDYRLTHFLLRQEADQGVLFFHTLTCELLLLTNEEAENALSNDELRRRGFVVPTDFSEHDFAVSVRSLYRKRNPPTGEITAYSLMTTLGCNARCFYCFERGLEQSSMTPETAHKAARFMAEHCGGKQIMITWFGGEPLCNRRVIDLICDDLTALGVDYQSMIISNTSLFDEETAEKAMTLWRLKELSVTLDGTEEVYNRTKAYVGTKTGSPFYLVLSNIERLLDRGLKVTVRMNVTEENTEDLSNLIDYLHERFSGRENLKAYTYLLFQLDDADRTRRERVAAKNDLLREKLQRYGMNAWGKPDALPKQIKLNRCGADSGVFYAVRPDGRLSLCDVNPDASLIGTLDTGFQYAETAALWKEYNDELPACRTCPLYPQCLYLKKCTRHRCFEDDIRHQKQELLLSMEAVYRRYWNDPTQASAAEPEKAPAQETAPVRREDGDTRVRFYRDFVSERFGDSYAVVPVANQAGQTGKLLWVNRAGLAILEHLKTDITREALVKALAEEFHFSETAIAEDVGAFLSQLAKKGMLI